MVPATPPTTSPDAPVDHSFSYEFMFNMTDIVLINNGTGYQNSEISLSSENYRSSDPQYYVT